LMRFDFLTSLTIISYRSLFTSSWPCFAHTRHVKLSSFRKVASWFLLGLT
jgi:hypothetical protein